MAELSGKALALIDVEREIAVTRKVLQRLPAGQLGWQVHPKSMNLGRLAMHVVNLLQWSIDTLERDGLDMATTPPMRDEPVDVVDILRTFDQKAAALRAALARLDEAALSRPWTLRHGDQVIFAESRAKILRVWCLNHLVHHRAQLCVYLRLLNVPVPAVYFNSADEPEWVFE
jgi:uncharacterized damage-inducible protein DinB